MLASCEAAPPPWPPSAGASEGQGEEREGSRHEMRKPDHNDPPSVEFEHGYRAAATEETGAERTPPRLTRRGGGVTLGVYFPRTQRAAAPRRKPCRDGGATTRPGRARGCPVASTSSEDSTMVRFRQFVWVAAAFCLGRVWGRRGRRLPESHAVGPLPHARNAVPGVQPDDDVLHRRAVSSPRDRGRHPDFHSREQHRDRRRLDGRVGNAVRARVSGQWASPSSPSSSRRSTASRNGPTRCRSIERARTWAPSRSPRARSLRHSSRPSPTTSSALRSCRTRAARGDARRSRRHADH